MKRIYSLPLISLFLILFTNSCNKDFDTPSNDNSQPENSNWATAYYKQLIREQGRKVSKVKNTTGISTSSVNFQNYKHTIWKKAYYSETSKATFVEIPLLYNQRSALIKSKVKITEAEELEIYRTSFDRLIIYKDKKTGEIDQRIVTYIPSLTYLRAHNRDISHNRIDKLDKDFSGYLEYKNWNGKRLFRVELQNGRTIGIFNFPAENLKKKSGPEVKTLYECGSIPVNVWEEQVTSEWDPELQQTIWGVTATVIDTFWEPMYCDDYLTGDPCIDWGIECNTPLTGDDCIDYGFCPSTPIPQPEAIQKNQFTNPCFKLVLSKYTLGTYGTAGSVSSLGTILNLSFGLSSTWSLNFLDATTLVDDNNNVLEGSAKADFDPADSSKIIVAITLNKTVLANASQEYIASVLLHEIEHAYLRKLYPESPSTSHEAMAQDFMRNQMVEGILAGFYNATDSEAERTRNRKDAEALAWGGLNEDDNGNYITLSWRNLKQASPSKASDIKGRVSNHVTGVSGTDCP